MSMSIRLQELRQKSQLSQEELAERIGVSRQAVSKWESEQSSPDIENVIRLSEVYNTSTDYILKGIEPTVINMAPKRSSYSGVIGRLILIGGIMAIMLLSLIGTILVTRLLF